MSSHPIQVFSEIGKLKKVMLHRPSRQGVRKLVAGLS
ncbi:arginine deiminase [Streptococcus pneumoniae]|nr:arginine deiminase [Streptococcus pneumoniae]